MKRLIIEIAAIIIMAAIIFTSIKTCSSYKEESERVKNNYESILKDNALQQELTVKELKKYYSEEIEKLKELGISSSNVTNLVKVRYKYIDSVLYRTEILYDTVKIKDTSYRTGNFDVEAKCQRIKGRISSDSLYIDEINYNDSLSVILYQTTRCLFKKKKFRAIIYSSCLNDTVQVIHNIKIEK